MGHIFLSYKKGDRATAALLVQALESEGFEVWWDQHLQPGDHWRETLTQQLMAASCVIVLWSNLSVGADGRFVHDEARRAQRRGVYLPVRLEDVEPPLGFGELQSIKLIGWRGDRQAAGFRALVAAAGPMVSGEAAPRPGPVGSSTPPPRGIDRRLLVGGGAAIAVATVAGALSIPAVRRRIGLGAPDAGPSSIVVLPFRNLSGDPRQDYLGDGVSEELRNALARLGSIRVAARTSSEAFRGAQADLSKIAEKLGVGYVLDGSVRSAADRLRVTAQLVDAKTGFERWSQSFDRVLTDVISVQTDIAGQVVEALQVRLLAGQAALVATPLTTAPAAYDALLRGNDALVHAGDEAEYRAAVSLFDQAIAADPKYAEAYARKASALQAQAAQFASADQVRAASEMAIAAAERAVALAPNSGYAQAILGYVLLFGRLDVGRARGPYARSIQLAPNDARVIGGYGQFAAKIRRTDVSLSTLARAVALDPLNPGIFRAQAQALIAARQYPRAVEAMRRGLAVNPKVAVSHSVVGDALLLGGDVTGALQEYRAEPAEIFRLTGLAIGLRRADDVAGADAALNKLTSTYGAATAYQQAQIHAQRGDAGAAFAALDLALSIGDSGLISVAVDPFLDPIRKDPRLLPVLRRLGLT